MPVPESATLAVSCGTGTASGAMGAGAGGCGTATAGGTDVGAGLGGGAVGARSGADCGADGAMLGISASAIGAGPVCPSHTRMPAIARPPRTNAATAIFQNPPTDRSPAAAGSAPPVSERLGKERLRKNPSRKKRTPALRFREESCGRCRCEDHPDNQGENKRPHARLDIVEFHQHSRALRTLFQVCPDLFPRRALQAVAGVLSELARKFSA